MENEENVQTGDSFIANYYDIDHNELLESNNGSLRDRYQYNL